jgi:hypothetical protein
MYFMRLFHSRYTLTISLVEFRKEKEYPIKQQTAIAVAFLIIIFGNFISVCNKMLPSAMLAKTITIKKALGGKAGDNSIEYVLATAANA